MVARLSVFFVYGIVANASFFVANASFFVANASFSCKKEVTSHDGTSSYEGLYNEMIYDYKKSLISSASVIPRQSLG